MRSTEITTPAEASLTSGNRVRRPGVVRGAAALALVAATVAGCTSKGAENAPLTTVNLNSAPAKLPDFVAKQGAPAANQEFLTKANGTTLASGSGIFVNMENQVVELTAAHVAADANGHCASQVIYAQPGSNSGNRYGNAYGAIKQSGAAPYSESSPYNPNYNGGVDGDIQILNSKRAFTDKAISADDIQSDPSEIPPGATVYVVGFGLTNGKYRGTGSPAEFSLTIIGQNGSDYEAIEGYGKSYSSVDRNVVEPGDSGAPVFVNNALIGLVVSSTTNDPSEKLSASTIRKDFNVIVPNGSYNLADISPMGEYDLENRQTAANDSAVCPTLPQ